LNWWYRVGQFIIQNALSCSWKLINFDKTKHIYLFTINWIWFWSWNWCSYNWCVRCPCSGRTIF
jgi:hypothetical protein